MYEPAIITEDDSHPAPCAKTCDRCGKGKTCDALVPVLERLAPAREPSQTEGASWT